MPNGQIPPQADEPLLLWSTDAKSLLLEGYADFHLTLVQAQLFEERQESYAEALAKSRAELTRGPHTIAIKKIKKRELLETARELCRYIANNPQVEAEHKLSLGLKPRKPATPSPVPNEAPDTDVVRMEPTSLRVRIHNNDTTKGRRRPEGVSGACVWYWLGSNPPLEPRTWHFAGNFTREVATLNFAYGLQPGTKVFIVAGWYNKVGDIGPLSVPAEVTMGGNSLAQQAQQIGGDAIMQAA